MTSVPMNPEALRNMPSMPAAAVVSGGGSPRYVLVTPVRNEAAFIELTLQSMVSQTVLPVKWIIVNDGSTDGTDAIVQKYLPGRDWIELLSLPERKERS